MITPSPVPEAGENLSAASGHEACHAALEVTVMRFSPAGLKSKLPGATESVTPTASAARVTVTGLPEVLPEAARTPT